MSISTITHPLYEECIYDWEKWRLTYNSGQDFINRYLQKFSSREEDTDFNIRKSITYCPAFAKSAVNDVKNSIYQRLVDISRIGGTKSYQNAVSGDKFGVDLLGSSMNFFMGTKVLPELLVMKKVGVYVDMPQVNKQLTVADSYKYNGSNYNRLNYNGSNYDVLIRPYLYIYHAEDIRGWRYDEGANANEFKILLLRENQYVYDDYFGLPQEVKTIYRLFKLINVGDENNLNNLSYTKRKVQILTFETYVEETTNKLIDNVLSEVVLDIDKIPFVCLELSHSLMADIADYQIALLNMASSDIMYSLKSNFPFYVEQFDPRAISPYTKGNEEDVDVEVGTASGRRYPLGTERPAFIHPSSDPLLASMQKQEQLMKEIRLLINLSISNIQARSASLESKSFDQQSLESGLSYIGLELENAERRIGLLWSMYEGSNSSIPSVKYPEKYNLKSDEERRNDCTQLEKLINGVPSKTYQKEIAKNIANILLRNRVPDSKLEQIYKEVDNSDVVNIDPEIVTKDVEQGLVSLDTASRIRGYPEGEVEKAKVDHAERLSRIAISQTEGAAAARGVNDLGSEVGGGDGKTEKDVSKNIDDISKSKKPITSNNRIRGLGK